VPANADAVVDAPFGHGISDGVDPARDLVARHPGVLDAVPQRLPREAVAVADTTGLDGDPHFVGPRLRDRALDHLDRLLRRRYLGDPHRVG